MAYIERVFRPVQPDAAGKLHAQLAKALEPFSDGVRLFEFEDWRANVVDTADLRWMKDLGLAPLSAIHEAILKRREDGGRTMRLSTIGRLQVRESGRIVLQLAGGGSAFGGDHDAMAERLEHAKREGSPAGLNRMYPGIQVGQARQDMSDADLANLWRAISGVQLPRTLELGQLTMTISAPGLGAIASDEIPKHLDVLMAPSE